MTQRRGAQEAGGELGLSLSPHTRTHTVLLFSLPVWWLTGSSFAPPCQDDIFCHQTGRADILPVCTNHIKRIEVQPVPLLAASYGKTHLSPTFFLLYY